MAKINATAVLIGGAVLASAFVIWRFQRMGEKAVEKTAEAVTGAGRAVINTVSDQNNAVNVLANDAARKILANDKKRSEWTIGTAFYDWMNSHDYDPNANLPMKKLPPVKTVTRHSRHAS